VARVKEVVREGVVVARRGQAAVAGVRDVVRPRRRARRIIRRINLRRFELC
jgi:hypothetical protein